MHRALLSVYRALLSVHRALLRVYRALLSVYRALLSVYRTFETKLSSIQKFTRAECKLMNRTAKFDS